ncbi:MAG: helix-turn-helix transcriptional regulator, partial [Ruminococcaceae bacterium]|nr:helix-turn-helix transcriptional regulator [Oscillospiraceae bacterium]
MAHIGIKIKELRKKKDMTQEKLAEYLNVSFQAVSKWETGAASPDLSMIVPLARLLDVTTDELFGVDSNEELLRQEKLKEIYYETWKTGDIEKRYKISKTAVEEYPGNLEYLKWLADAEGSFGILCNKLGSKEQIEHFERSVFYFEKIIEDSTDSHLKESAIRGIVFALSDLGRR